MIVTVFVFKIISKSCSRLPVLQWGGISLNTLPWQSLVSLPNPAIVLMLLLNRHPSPLQHNTMTRGPELTPQLRSRICELRSLGYSYGHIAAIHPEVKRSTIITTCRREHLRGNNQTRPHSGPPCKLTEEHRDHVYDLISHQDPHIKVRDLCAEVDHVVKEREIQRLCRELNRRKWKQQLRPEITEVHAQKRLEWARTYEHFTPDD
jgi:hypothetical protein